MSERDSEVLSAIAGHHPNSSGWIRADCPFCVTDAGKEDTTASLGVNADSGWFRCWRCGAEGRLSGFEGVPQEQEEPGERPPLALPRGFVTADRAWDAVLADDAVEYLLRRGVGREQAAQIGIGFCFSGFYEKRIVVPIYDAQGELANWAARTWDSAERMRYRYPPGGRRVLFNGEALAVETDVPVLVVEGVFDAFPYWPNVVACCGKPTEQHIEELKKAHRPIVVTLDGDAWRECEALWMLLLCHGKDARWLRLPAGEDPASVDADGLWEQALEAP